MNGLAKRRFFLAAVALGLSLIPARSQTTLVPTGSVWKYFDQGYETNGWRSLLFDHSGWSNGIAQLGFGDDGEATKISQTNSAGVTNISFYFRHTFNVFNPPIYTNLLVRLRRDDGAIVYLNDFEIFRSNMPLGPVNANTLARTSAADGGTNFFAALVSRTFLNLGDNQLAVEIHQWSTTSTDVSFDLEFLGNVDATKFQPPTIGLIAPGGGDILGPNATLVANATDSDGTVAGVDFFDGTSWIGSSTAPRNLYYALSWTNMAPGTHPLTAVAVDSTGLSATSAPVSITVLPALIPRGAAWNYLDDGSNAGTAWKERAFDDHGWSNGIAQFGYGDSDEATRVEDNPIPGYGGEETNRYVTTYFRHVFEVLNPAGISNLVVHVLRDDGAILYLNGTEVFRNNMPTGPVTYITPALAAIEDEQFHSAQVSPSLVVTGANVLAAEIHQANVTSSDISFDFELLSNVPPTPPKVWLTAPTNGSSFLGPTNLLLTAYTSDVDSPVASVAFLDGPTLLGTANVEVEGDADLTHVFNPGLHTLRAVVTDTMGLSATSAPVSIAVVPAPILTTLVPTGSVWRFFDTNYAAAAGWRTAGFDDSAWRSGRGILGYGSLGSGEPATQINSNASANVRPITAYFRRVFNTTNAASVTNLAFGVVRDDGAVVYLNGSEVFRMNMPSGGVTDGTPVAPADAVGGADETYYFPTNIVPALGMLLEGTNILAVELHQIFSSITAPRVDAGFDLGLVAISAPPGTQPPLHIAFDGMRVRLTWEAHGFTLQEAGSPQGPYETRTNSVSPVFIPPTLPSRFFRLSQP